MVFAKKGGCAGGPAFREGFEVSESPGSLFPFPPEEWITEGGVPSSGHERIILRTLASGLDQGLVVLDELERLVLINPNARRVFGPAGPWSTGAPVTEIPVPPQIRGEWLAFLGSGQVEKTVTTRVKLASGARTLALRFLKVRDRQGDPLSSLLLVREFTPPETAAGLLPEFRIELHNRLSAVAGLARELEEGQDLSERERREFLLLLRQETSELAARLEEPALAQ